MVLTNPCCFLTFNILGGLLLSNIGIRTVKGFSVYFPVFVKRSVFSGSQLMSRTNLNSVKCFPRRHHVLCEMSLTTFDLPEICSVRNALEMATSIFKDEGVPEAQASAEYLLSSLMQCSRGTLRGEAAILILTDSQKELFQKYVQQRLCRTPVQYILGGWPFFNLEKDLILRPPTLIPRPETEELVELILQTYRKEARTPGRFLEVGPGPPTFMYHHIPARIPSQRMTARRPFLAYRR